MSLVDALEKNGHQKYFIKLRIEPNMNRKFVLTAKDFFEPELEQKQNKIKASSKSYVDSVV